jgi:hypothetical protein
MRDAFPRVKTIRLVDTSDLNRHGSATLQFGSRLIDRSLAAGYDQVVQAYSNPFAGLRGDHSSPLCSVQPPEPTRRPLHGIIRSSSPVGELLIVSPSALYEKPVDFACANYRFLPHLAAAAFFAIAFRLDMDRDAARACPPLDAPSLLMAKACGFLVSGTGSTWGSWPVASWTICHAS